MIYLSEPRKILFIGAHTDDIELSCGGAISKFIAQGHDVRCYVFSYCDNIQLLLEFQRSMNVLGVNNYVLNTYDNRVINYFRQKVLQDLCDYKESFVPDYIFTHDVADIHQDHSTIGMETLRAFKFHNIISYTHPWNGDINPNFFVSFGKAELEKKIEACQQYESQSHRHYMNEDMIRVNSLYWTNRSPYNQYCEAFNIINLYD
jgi:LmbE family N-acetylglucosaminyl deacetylase